MLNGGPLASLFQSYDFRPGSSFIAAVSGGSDSTALLLLLKTNLDRFHPDVRLIAATVDHGLRQGSAAEAQDVAALCAKMEIEHRTLYWTGEKPSCGIQAAARIARHRLLADLAQAEGPSAVFTGHTRDDQAETILMRSARGTGPGSAGIAPATLFDGRVWFLRPLLEVGRNELRKVLEARGIGWADDPSNSDRRYERARLRAELADAEDAGARIEAAIASGREAAEQRYALARSTAGLLRAHLVLGAPGLMRLDRRVLDEALEAAVHVLRVLLAVAGGANHLPDLQRVEHLVQELREGRVRANLSRALVDGRKDAVYLLREGRGLPEHPPATATVWDRRYRIVEARAGRRVESSRSDQAPESLLRAAAATLPKLSDDQDALPVVGPWADFLPVFDLVVANEVAKLIGAPEFPAPPFRGHIENST